MHKNLEARWIALWDQLPAYNQAALNPQVLFAELVARYSEPQRAYHTLAHLEHCFAEFDEVAHLVEDPLAVQFALWYHDSIYDPRRNDNEKLSAKLAESIVTVAGLGHKFGLAVSKHILATEHTDQSLSADTELLLDIDLAILGQSKERFDEYEREVRIEYDWVPEGAFRNGRTAILKGFLARPNIYYTRLFQEKYEEQARKNLNRSIESLETVENLQN